MSVKVMLELYPSCILILMDGWMNGSFQMFGVMSSMCKSLMSKILIEVCMVE